MYTVGTPAPGVVRLQGLAQNRVRNVMDARDNVVHSALGAEKSVSVCLWCLVLSVACALVEQLRMSLGLQG